MGKNWLKNGAIAVCAAILILDSFRIKRMEEELAALRSGYNGMGEYVHSGLTDIKNDMRTNQAELEKLIQKGQSMFQGTSVDVRLRDRQMEVSMSAVPKEMDDREILTARIAAGDRVYEQVMDGDNRAVMVIGLVDSITPSFVIKSPDGIRQETLDEIYLDNLLTCQVNGSWSADVGLNPAEEGRNMVYAWISAEDGRDTLPFGEEDIEKAEFIVENSGIVERPPSGMKSGSGWGFGGGRGRVMGSAGGSAAGSRVVHIPQGDRIAARKLAEGGLPIGYTADLTDYSQRKDGMRYEVYLMITTRDGMRYVTPDNPIASFSSYEGGQNRSGGSGTMWPVFS